MSYYDKLAQTIFALFNGRATPMLWSLPGEGKTAFVRSLSLREDVHRVIILGLSSSDRTDTLGVPTVIDIVVIENGVEMKRMATSNTSPDWAVECLDAPSDKKVIVFVDEMPQAQPDVLATFLTVIQDKIMPNRMSLPSNTHFIGAGNPPRAIRSGYELSSAMTNRLVHFDFAAPIDDWLPLFADGFGRDISDEERDLRAALAGLLHASPNLLDAQNAENGDDLSRGWMSKRSIDSLASTLWAVEGDYAAGGWKYQVIVGTVGEPRGVTIINHLRDSKRIPPEELVKNPKLIDEMTLSQTYTAILSLVSWVQRASDKDESIARRRAAWGVINRAGEVAPAVTSSLMGIVFKNVGMTYGYDPKVFADLVSVINSPEYTG